MEPEHYATILLKDLGLCNLPINPFDIAIKKGIDIAEIDMKGIEGFLLRERDGNNARVCISKNITNKGRNNFTLAHELGHFSIPTHRNTKFECTSQYLSPFHKKPVIEVEANRFASELLLPEPLLRPLIHQFKPDFDDINELAQICDTSLTATTIKYLSLTHEPCALIATSHNRVEWSKRSSSFNYYTENGTPVAKGTLTESYTYKGVQQVAAQKTAASLWLEGKGINRESALFEHCISMPNYKIILTILWFADLENEDEIEGEYRYEETDWKWNDSDA